MWFVAKSLQKDTSSAPGGLSVCILTKLLLMFINAQLLHYRSFFFFLQTITTLTTEWNLYNNNIFKQQTSAVTISWAWNNWRFQLGYRLFTIEHKHDDNKYSDFLFTSAAIYDIFTMIFSALTQKAEFSIMTQHK